MLLSFHIISVFSDFRLCYSYMFFQFITRKGQKGGILIPCGFLVHQAVDDVRIFHEGLFWRCSFVAVSNEYSVWDLWMCKKLHFAVVCVMQLCFQIWQSVITASFPSANQPPSKICQAAFLFPFPVHEPVRSRAEPRGLPTEPYEHHSAIGWCYFLI